jgi:AraC-like DNA-binding protein
MDTRGILRPAALGRVFSLERRPGPEDLSHLIDHHWIVSWDLRGRDSYRSEVMAHPAVHLVFEPHGVAVFGVHRRRYVRTLAGQGWAVGTKFLPGGFAAFTERPVRELTDDVLALAAVFGPAGERLEREAGAQAEPQPKLALLHRFLRARLPESTDPNAALVQAVVADMRAASPGCRVGEIAERHHLSTRTLQRLFADYVGVSPKWVLQRNPPARGDRAARRPRRHRLDALRPRPRVLRPRPLHPRLPRGRRPLALPVRRRSRSLSRRR